MIFRGEKRNALSADSTDENFTVNVKRCKVRSSPGELRLQSDMKEMKEIEGVSVELTDMPSTVLIRFYHNMYTTNNTSIPGSFLMTVPHYYPHKAPIVRYLYQPSSDLICDYILENGNIVHPTLGDDWSAIGTLIDVINILHTIREYLSLSNMLLSSNNTTTTKSITTTTTTTAGVAENDNSEDIPYKSIEDTEHLEMDTRTNGSNNNNNSAVYTEQNGSSSNNSSNSSSSSSSNNSRSYSNGSSSSSSSSSNNNNNKDNFNNNNSINISRTLSSNQVTNLEIIKESNHYQNNTNNHNDNNDDNDDNIPQKKLKKCYKHMSDNNISDLAERLEKGFWF